MLESCSGERVKEALGDYAAPLALLLQFSGLSKFGVGKKKKKPSSSRDPVTFNCIEV